jgi:putative aldouronate transport system substrate-binding protein
MKHVIKSFALMLVCMMLIPQVVVGADQPKFDKEVKIIGYLLGDAPAGMPDVMAKLNEKLKKDLNATMEIRYIGWGDFQSKYPLVLAAGEDIDWIFTANWSFYFQQAVKGAFLEITEEMMQKYMPRHYAVLNKVAYQQAKVNGKVYMIPTATPDRKVPVMLIRGDLRKKYGVPEIKKFSDIEPYLEAIKKNEPGMVPMNLDSTYDIGFPFAALAQQNGDYFTDILYATGSGTGVVWGLEDPTGKLLYLMDEPVITQFKQAAATMKSWYEKGYINKDVFSNKVRSKDAFNQGKSAVGIGNSQDIQANLADAKSKGWEVEIIPALNVKGHYTADPYINNGIALAAGTKNPERVLMALDLIMEDKDYDYLVYFGVEGKNYVIKDGKIALPEGVTADKNTYPPDAAGFWFTNKDLFLPLATWDDNYIALRNAIKEKGYLVNHPLAAFSANTESIKTEVANLNQVMIQYFQPINVGMVKDIDAAFKTLDEKLKAAGVDKVRAEFQKQIDAYIQSLK